MGVPKFYRWLSERYPCLSQVIREHQIPEFDNLYLDMNGIIHPCSHPNDDDPHFRITEADIFKNIFNYIEVLFRIIKPKRNFFMAVDGCAPRAKMNQQRSRRFRTAKEAEDNIRKALLKGQTLPSQDRFDSNCITPGTEFMARLQMQLKYFVNKKISTDPLWQNCTVYLSGHDVPGEGEHKIMDFIRYCKSKPGYDPNTRHCLYGLDADLIVLGLTAHEPHFALLREEVRFGKQAKHMIRPEQQTFHLLHLSLLREYIDFEFSSLKPSLHFTYDLEKLIDDWVVLGFLVGNDFVPHLPHMHINQDALPYLFEIYKEFICSTDGYINNGGELNLFRLKKFFELLSKFDRDRFDEVYADLKWLESKTSGDLLNNEGTPQKKKFSKFLVSLDGNEYRTSPVKTRTPYSVLAQMSGTIDELSFSESPGKSVKPVVKTGDDDGEDVEIEDEETFELEFKQHKRHYYMEKFDMDIVDDDQIQIICGEYMMALQWIAHYYFNGLQSWSWYYPYHYAPYISDVAKFQVRPLNFDIAKPFLPFEQLLAVLPAGSRKLLPTAFQHLMIMDNSPIIDYYPPDFRTDLNGKQQEWEAVVLIPFIDEVRLLKAMLPNYAHLTDEEKERNSFGKCFVYNYDKALNFVYPSSYPQQFPDITICKAKVEEVDRKHFHLPISMLKKGMMEGTLLDVYFPGFPTMKHLEHTSYLKKAGVKVFQQHSRNKSMIVKIFPKHNTSIEDMSDNLVGKIAHVEWPYMVEALVTSVCNDSIRYHLDHNNQLQSKLLGGDEYKSVMREMKGISSYHMERKGVELGDVNVLVEAKLLHGQRYIFQQKGNIKLEKEWSPHSTFYDFKTVIKDLSVHNEPIENYASIDELYTPGASIFMMAAPYYGASGEVLECDRATARVRVALKVVPEPDFNHIINKYDSLAVHYVSDRAVAQRLGISTYLLGCITGDVCIYESVEKNKRSLANIGLKLKYSGQNKEALGFARRAEHGWTYSPKTIGILRLYMEKFPDVFEAIENSRNPFVFSAMFPKQGKSYLDKISSFLKEQVCYHVTPVRCGSNILDQPIVHKIEEALEKATSKEGKKIVKVKIKPHLLFRVTEHFGRLTPDPDTDFMLFDRVVNVENGITVPVGLRGTIVGIHEVLTVENDKNSPQETRYEILFDESFLGAVTCRSKEKRGYFLSACSLLNITYGERKERYKKNIPLSTAMVMQSKISQTSDKNSSILPANSQDAIHSPKQVLLKPHHNRRSGSPEKQHSNSKEGLVTPDYWLKGSYSNKPNPTTEKTITNHSSNQQVNDNNDFLTMWKEMEKTDQSNKSPENTGVDQNATAVLQKLLHLPNQAPSLAFNQQPRQIQPRLHGSHHSTQFRPFGYPMGGIQRHPAMQCYTNQRGVPVINPIRLASPMFPIAPVPIGVSQSSHYQVYRPPYLFTSQPRPYQQHHDRSSSPRYNQSNEGKKSTHQKNSGSQFYSTSNKENPFVPHQVLMKNRSSANTSSPVLPESPSSHLKCMLGVSEAEGTGNSWNSSSHLQRNENLEEQDNNLKELIGIPIHSKEQKETMAAQSKSQELKDLIGLMPSVQTSTPSNDDKLKELLGVGISQTKWSVEEHFKDQTGMPSTDDTLKKMLGVAISQTKPPIEEHFKDQTSMSSNDDMLKKMLGVGISQTKQPIEEHFKDQTGTSSNDDTLKKMLGVGISQTKQSGEDYLKDILGVRPPAESSELKHVVKLPNQSNSPASSHLIPSAVENKELVDGFTQMLVTNNISSNIKPSLSPVPRTGQSNVSKPPVDVTTSPEETKKKKQILLAPSFFGPKKK